MTIGWCFDNTYSRLPESFKENIKPVPVKNPELVVLNKSLAEKLNLNFSTLNDKEISELFGGNSLPPESNSIAQAYAGHQFGHFTMLGDGRAVLIGEHLSKKKDRYDIQFKGSGKTAFSRNGDGRAALGPMLREYLISEAMYNLGIPSTRSLAVVKTGEEVIRETSLQGAILTRVALSHIRVGTFQYIAARQKEDELKTLLNYVIDRHYPSIKNSQNKSIDLLKIILDKQIDLVVNWMRVGFIHGVMNTDNTTISGETIDYGPCAFMNNYNPSTVYSYIDVNGRYAYGNQAQIIFWNLTKFSQTLSGIIDENEKRSNKLIISSLEKFPEIFNSAWKRKIRKKFGFTKLLNGDDKIILEFLEILLKQKVDYTSAFRKLSCSLENEIKKQDLFSLFSEKVAIKNWFSGWNNRMKKEKEKVNKIMVFLKKTNPSVIPRNHVVENVINMVINNDDMNSFEELMDLLKNPYDDYDNKQHLITPPKENEDIKNTFCGT